jgi:hypothetical protein
MLTKVFCLFAILTSFSACTGTLDTSDIRRGNYEAPKEMQVSESCDSSKQGDSNCRVVISSPPPPKEAEGSTP